ncbi:unnamed protein product, partial [Lampetra planeri]
VSFSSLEALASADGHGDDGDGHGDGGDGDGDGDDGDDGDGDDGAGRHRRRRVPSLAGACRSTRCDVTPGAYEGGLKTWEGTWDLLGLMARGGGGGGGGGRGGVGADYNEEVLREVTMPNVLLNVDHGDHGNRGGLRGGLRYDVALTSESCYRPDSLRRLHSLLVTLLAPGGRAYVAGKRHYFGLGGGTGSLERYAESRGEMGTRVAKCTLRPREVSNARWQEVTGQTQQVPRVD